MTKLNQKQGGECRAKLNWKNCWNCPIVDDEGVIKHNKKDSRCYFSSPKEPVKWEKEFEKDFPPFTGVGAMFPIFQETPNRNHIKLFIKRTLSQQKKEVLGKILAKLAVEVMEVEVMKSKDIYIDGHSHGVKRAIYLIKELSQLEDNQRGEE